MTDKPITIPPKWASEAKWYARGWKDGLAGKESADALAAVYAPKGGGLSALRAYRAGHLAARRSAQEPKR